MSRTTETAVEAEAEAVATRTPPKGVAAAVEAFRAGIDEDAQVLWKANGPRKTHTEELAAVLVETAPGRRDVILVQGFVSGKFKIFRECSLDELKGGAGFGVLDD